MMTQDRLLQLKDGDADAFAELYELGQSKLFGYFYSRTSDAQLSEDLSHDVWTKVMNRLDKYQPQEGIPIMAWIFRIAHNILVDCVRSGGRISVLSVDRLAENGDDWQPEDTKVRTQDIHALRQDVQTALWGLGDKQKEVVLHRFFRGHSILETAHAMDLSEDAVKKLQSRAMFRMRKILGRDYYG